MELNKHKIGEFIIPINEKNKDGLYDEVLGVSIEKEFMPSVANLIGTDLKKYMVLRNGRFAFNPMHVGRDEKLPIAVYRKDEPALVSPAYSMFEISSDKINLDYLMLLFKTPLFDHLCWFNTDGSVRGGLSWNDFCEIEVNIPDITEQEKIVRQYKTVTDRICLLEKLNAELEKLISTIYINNTRDYEGEKTVIKVEDYCKIFTGKKDVNKALQEGKNHFYSCSPEPLFSNESVYEGLAILVAGNGSYTGRTTIVNEAFDLYQRTYAITPFEKDNEIMYLIYAAMQTDFQEQLKSSLHGSAIPYIVYSDLAEFSFEVTTDIGKISNVIKSFVDIKLKNIEEIIELKKISKILLTKYF